MCKVEGQQRRIGLRVLPGRRVMGKWVAETRNNVGVNVAQADLAASGPCGGDMHAAPA